MHANTAAENDGALPVSPGLLDEELRLHLPTAPSDSPSVDSRTAVVAGLAIVVAIGAGLVAQLLTGLIAFITNIAFYHELSLAPRAPYHAHVGAWVIVIPVLGALVIGLMARYGSQAIRGHGIPEVMERVLYGES